MGSTRWVVVLVTLALGTGAAAAEPWSRSRVSSLPDSAFAVVERAPDGHMLRHLPHHDETGALDPAHLSAARARLKQVKWLDPASEAAARAHLAAHEPETASVRWRRRPDVRPLTFGPSGGQSSSNSHSTSTK